MEIQVFARSSRRLTLTNAGEKLLFRARTSGHERRPVSDPDADGFSGIVRLGVCFDLLSPSVATVIRDYSLVRPNVEVALAVHRRLLLNARLPRRI
jgi:DNA-binding transcriptional LysR family regulator